MSFADRYFERLGSASITAAATTVTVSFQPRSLLFVEFFVASWSQTFMSAGIIFNSDGGNNYTYSNPIVSAGGVTWGNNFGGAQPCLQFGGNEGTAAGGVNAAYWIINPLTAVKTITGIWGMRSGGVTTTSEPAIAGGCWNNTTSLISSITLNTVPDGAGGIATMGAGSAILVYGCDY